MFVAVARLLAVARAPLLTRFYSFFGYSDPIYDHGDASGFNRDGFRCVTLQIGGDQTVQIDDAILGLNANGNRTLQLRISIQ